jgi:hypothetical protein
VVKEEVMASHKRIAIATLFGVVSGILCYLGGRGLGIDISLASFLMLLSHRTLLGFVIGISSLRWHWALHGILLGLIVGIPDIHFFNMVRGELSNGLYFLFGGVWGLLIEFFTSVAFKARLVQG